MCLKVTYTPRAAHSTVSDHLTPILCYVQDNIEESTLTTDYIQWRRMPNLTDLLLSSSLDQMVTHSQPAILHGHTPLS